MVAMTNLAGGAARRWRASGFYPAMQSPAMRRLLPAFAVSAIGDGMSAVAVAWLAISIAAPSDRGLLVGLAVAAYSLPGAAGLVLLARPLRGLSGKQLVAVDSVLRAVTLGLIPVLYACGVLHPWQFVALLAASSLVHAWGLSGQYTLVSEYLPPDARTAGNALLSGFGMSALIIGPLLAGLVVAFAGAALPVAIDAGTFAVLAAAALTARRPARLATTPGEETAIPGVKSTGFSIIARRRALAGLLALTVVFYFLYGPVEVALPLYVSGPLHGGAGLLGLFWTVFGIGATAGSIVTGLVRRLPLWPTLLIGVVGWGAALLPMGLFSLTVPALAGFAAGGLLYAPYPALSVSLFQRESPPESLSQVLAARGAGTVLATPLGTALGGPLTAWLGAQHTLLISAIATIALGFGATIFSRSIRKSPAHEAQ
ncbi:MAG TPA: MFS transporter [Trebonia sp.]|jgi:MFS family permease|nr:MFS transporter [Trebonia sp.]